MGEEVSILDSQWYMYLKIKCKLSKFTEKDWISDFQIGNQISTHCLLYTLQTLLMHIILYSTSMSGLKAFYFLDPLQVKDNLQVTTHLLQIIFAFTSCIYRFTKQHITYFSLRKKWISMCSFSYFKEIPIWDFSSPIFIWGINKHVHFTTCM